MGRDATAERRVGAAAPGGLLDLVDCYFDAAPRSGARPEEVGPFTLFVSTSAWSYAARPRRGFDGPIVRDDVARLGARCDALGLKLSLEWVGELAPTLEGAARAFGLRVEPHPLLAIAPGELRAAPAPTGVRLELLAADDARLVAARAVADASFAAGGTGVSGVGAQARDARLADIGPEMRRHLAERTAAALTFTAVASDPLDGVVATGSLQPIAETAEIVAVATLPSHRRRGLAAALTSKLVGAAAERGVRVVILAAENEAVARIYGRLGFRPVGTQVAARRRAVRRTVALGRP